MDVPTPYFFARVFAPTTLFKNLVFAVFSARVYVLCGIFGPMLIQTDPATLFFIYIPHLVFFTYGENHVVTKYDMRSGLRYPWSARITSYTCNIKLIGISGALLYMDKTVPPQCVLSDLFYRWISETIIL